MALETVEIRGTFLKASDDEPLVGRIEFELTTPLQDAAGNVIYEPVTVMAPLDETGHFAKSLVATDATGVSPAGARYRVTHRLYDPLTGAKYRREPYLLEVPKAAPGGFLDLADVAPAIAVDPTVTYVLETEFETHVLGTAAENVHPGYLTMLPGTANDWPNAQYFLARHPFRSAAHIGTDLTGATSALADVQASHDYLLDLGGGLLWWGPGVYLLDGTFFHDGKVNCIFDPDAILLCKDATVANSWGVWWAAGTRVRLEAALITPTIQEAAGIANVTHVINIFDAERFTLFRPKVLSSGAFNQSSIIHAGNNSGWVSRSVVRRDGLYDNPHIDVVQDGFDGGEGISIASTGDGYAERIKVIEPTVLGVGDDAVAFHGVTKATLRGGRLESQDGRVFLSDCEYFDIDGPHMLHKAAAGGSSFVWLDWENADTVGGLGRGCNHGRVRNCEAVAFVGQTPGYGLRSRGSHDVDAENNHWRNENNHVFNGEYFEDRPAGGAVTVEHKQGNITTDGVKIRGGRLHVSAANGRDAKMLVKPTLLDGQGKVEPVLDFPDASFASGDEVIVTGVRGALTVQDIDVPGSVIRNKILKGLFHKGALAAATAGQVLHLSEAGIVQLKLVTPAAICQVVTRLSGVPSGTVTFKVLTNGAAWQNFAHTNASGAERQWDSASAGHLSARTWPAGSVISATADTPAGLAALDCELELWIVPIL